MRVLFNTRVLDYSEADSLVRALLAATFRNSVKSVDEIAERMTASLKHPITAGMLRQFAASTKKTARFPLLLLPAFLEVVEDSPLRTFALGPEGERIFRLGEAAAAVLSEAAQERLLARRKK